MIKKSSCILVTLLLIQSTIAIAQERASLNADEFNCREDVKACIAQNDSDRGCLVSQALQTSCQHSPLHDLLAQRANLAYHLTDQSCLKHIDAELSADLQIDEFNTEILKTLSSHLSQCERDISEEILKP